jgi:dTDP-4-dehydrorhamnose reductase
VTVGTVLLTGASGLLGTWLRRTAPEDVEVVGLTHRKRLGAGEVIADLRDAGAVVAAVRRVRPSLVIHAGYAHDQASIVGATQNVVDAAEGVGADVVYISTDAVFSGDGSRRYENDTPDPVWDYGQWKAQAEQIVTNGHERSAIVRLPLIVSLDPEDHVVESIRIGAAGNNPTTWFRDEFRQPATAPDLAEALWRIALLGQSDRAGTWHLPGPESLNRYEIAQRVVAALGLSISAIKQERTPQTANRPRNIELGDARARDCIGWSPSTVLCGNRPP